MNYSYIHIEINRLTLLFASRTEVISIQDCSRSVISKKNYDRVRNFIPSGFFNCQWNINLNANTKLYSYFENEIEKDSPSGVSPDAREVRHELKPVSPLSAEEIQATTLQLTNNILNGDIEFISATDLKRYGDRLADSEDTKVSKELIPLLTFFKRVLWIPDYDWSDFCAVDNSLNKSIY